MNPNSPSYNQTRWWDAGTQGACPSCLPQFVFASGLTQIYNNTSLTGSTVTFTWVVYYPSGATNFTLGNVTSACCYPTATRTVPMILGSSVFILTISPSGSVQAQLVSGPIPSGGVGFHGTYDLYTTTYYSAAKSGVFTRNNCPAGQVGSNVTYNVAAYTYTSTVDQPTADQLAQNDVNANGQNYANNNGTCSVACSFTPSVSFYSSSITSSGGTANFNFVFPSPNSSYNGGTIGTITGGCLPSGPRTVTVTDMYTPSRTWSVTIQTSGSVQITRLSGPSATNSGPPIGLSGSYSL